MQLVQLEAQGMQWLPSGGRWHHFRLILVATACVNKERE